MKIQSTLVHDYREDTLIHYFDEICEKYSNKTAIIEHNNLITFKQLKNYSLSVGINMVRNGIKRGDVVAIYCANTLQFVVSYLSLARIGAIACMLNVRYEKNELIRTLGVVNAKGLILPEFYHGKNLLNPILEIWKKTPSLKWLSVINSKDNRYPCDVFHFEDWLTSDKENSCSNNFYSLDAPLVIFFTSGTEGSNPKACYHTHRSLMVNAASFSEKIKVTNDNIILSASQFTHMFGILSLNTGLINGVTQVLMDKFDEAKFVNLCREFNVNLTFIVPTHLKRILKILDKKDLITENLIKMVVSGATVTPNDLIELENKSNSIALPLWGMTEIGAGSLVTEDTPYKYKLQSIGKPIGDSIIAIYDEKNNKIAETGETGEILFYGTSLFKDYDKVRTSLIEINKRLWFKTGDLGQISKKGYIIFKGRKKDVINRGGVKINCLEIENILKEIILIEELALLPIPDEILGERGCLVIRTNHKLNLQNIQTYLSQKGVAKYKWPEKLILVDEFPYMRTGKISKQKLITIIKNTNNF